MSASLSGEPVCFHDGDAKPFQPGRLWSMWDMHKLEAHSFMAALSRLSELVALGKSTPEWVYGKVDQRVWFITNIDILISQLSLMSLRLSCKKADEMKTIIGQISGIPGANINANAYAELISDKLPELRQRIEQELEDRVLYCVKSESVDYLKQADMPFGKIVADKFPDISADISEGAYCIAMARNTACVFHLMRALEQVVQALGAKLGVTVIDKNNVDLEWGKILANINDAVGKLPKGDDKDAWASATSLLYYVKLAWRNSTMHPKATYTDDEVRAVFEASKSFTVSLCELV